MEEKSKWNYFLSYLGDCFQKPIKHPEFIGYFIVIIMAVGSIGWVSSVYIEFQNTAGFIHDNVLMNISSYSLAILATGSMDLMFHKDEVMKKPLNILGFGVLLLGILLFWIITKITPSFAYFISAFEILLAWALWWVANSQNAELTDESFFQMQSKKSKDLSKTLDSYEQ